MKQPMKIGGIEKGIPVPQVNSKYPFAEMEIGDSFFCRKRRQEPHSVHDLIHKQEDRQEVHQSQGREWLSHLEDRMTFGASRLIFGPRANEHARVLRTGGDNIIVETCVLTDRITPHMLHTGFIADLELTRPGAQALICLLADAIGMAIELKEPDRAAEIAERIAVEGLAP